MNLLFNISKSQEELNQDVALLQAQTLEKLLNLGNYDTKLSSATIEFTTSLTSITLEGDVLDRKVSNSIAKAVSTLIESKVRDDFLSFQ